MTPRPGWPAALVTLMTVTACGAPPDDRGEARARVEAAAESLRAAHEREWGVVTEDERARLAEDTVRADDEED